MKLFNLLLIITLSSTILSCEKEKNQSATIVRDCTGTYLRLDNKDYLVCNTKKTNEFEENDEVIATFKDVKDCRTNDAVCAVYHKTEGTIKVCKIRNN